LLAFAAVVLDRRGACAHQVSHPHPAPTPLSVHRLDASAPDSGHPVGSSSPARLAFAGSSTAPQPCNCLPRQGSVDTVHTRSARPHSRSAGPHNDQLACVPAWQPHQALCRTHRDSGSRLAARSRLSPPHFSSSRYRFLQMLHHVSSWLVLCALRIGPGPFRVPAQPAHCRTSRLNA